ncbi:hypothetical protein PVAP13_9KG079820, partial [Panicum virgatum]
ETLSKSNGVKLALHNLFAKVSKSNQDINASSYLQTGWVKLYGIPNNAKTEDAVKQIAELAGEVVMIDELSLIRDGPVMVKINGRNIHKINGFVEVFFGKAGHEIKFVAEGGNKGQSPPDPPQPKKPYEGSDGEGEDSERDTELE